MLADSLEPFTVNAIVLLCRGLSIINLLHTLLTTTSPAHLSNERTEWEEFFVHTIIDLIMPVFVRIYKPQTTPINYNTAILRYHICCLVDQLVTNLPISQWERLVTMVTGCSLYPEQLTAYKLATR